MIVDHKCSGDAIRMEDKYFVTKTGTKRIRQTTKGRSMLIEWTDGHWQWVDLKLLKHSNQLQVAEYAAAQGLTEGICMVGSVHITQEGCDCFGCESMPNDAQVWYWGSSSLKEALALDVKNSNNYWSEAVGKEMGTIVVAFEILEPNARPPPGWTRSSGHLIFDVKMDFTQKACWVKDGHRTPDAITSEVVI